MISTATTDLLTLEAVAMRLGVSKGSVENWVSAKDLASFKKGGMRRVSEEELTKFVLLNTVKPKRPDWLTAAVEADFRNMLRGIVKDEVGMAVWLEHQKLDAILRQQQQKKAA